MNNNWVIKLWNFQSNDFVMYYWIHVQIYKSVSTFEKLVPEDDPNLPPSDDMKTATNGVNYQYINALKELLRHVLKYKKVRSLHELTNTVIFYKFHLLSSLPRFLIMTLNKGFKISSLIFLNTKKHRLWKIRICIDTN